jgi:2-iminobutanoate/2-iminopropanoate deaminase
VVISGQVAVDLDGRPVGETIEEQTRATLDNCAAQLATAGSTFADVFKVNVYLADLADWARFNAVYERVLPEPRPVRTAVQAVLLSPYLVEIEMWAVQPEG